MIVSPGADARPARRRGRLVAALAAGLVLVTACNGSDDDDASRGQDQDQGAALVDGELPGSVLQVAEQGVAQHMHGSSGQSEAPVYGYGYVLENVSDMAALSIEVTVDLLDEAGNVIPDLYTSVRFSTLLPGERRGAGGYYEPEDGTVVADMRVRIVRIVALDDLDNPTHLDGPSAYAELDVAQPPADSAVEQYSLAITNTYDVPLTPMVTYVERGADGSIVGGDHETHLTGNDTPIPAGGTANWMLTRSVPTTWAVEGVATEVFLDPGLGQIIASNPVYDELITEE